MPLGGGRAFNEEGKAKQVGRGDGSVLGDGRDQSRRTNDPSSLNPDVRSLNSRRERREAVSHRRETAPRPVTSRGSPDMGQAPSESKPKRSFDSYPRGEIAKEDWEPTHEEGNSRQPSQTILSLERRLRDREQELLEATEEKKILLGRIERAEEETALAQRQLAEAQDELQTYRLVLEWLGIQHQADRNTWEAKLQAGSAAQNGARAKEVG